MEKFIYIEKNFFGLRVNQYIFLKVKALIVDMEKMREK